MTVVDLLAHEGRGPLWGIASEDLNATLLAWPAGEGTPEHVNDERDVLVVVLDGGGTVEVDEAPLSVRAGSLVLVVKGRRRRIVAAGEGIRYVTVHLRRGGLQLRRLDRL
jgi:quercetin dioxygenase-like cupin family protein